MKGGPLGQLRRSVSCVLMQAEVTVASTSVLTKSRGSHFYHAHSHPDRLIVFAPASFHPHPFASRFRERSDSWQPNGKSYSAQPPRSTSLTSTPARLKVANYVTAAVCRPLEPHLFELPSPLRLVRHHAQGSGAAQRLEPSSSLTPTFSSARLPDRLSLPLCTSSFNPSSTPIPESTPPLAHHRGIDC